MAISGETLFFFFSSGTTAVLGNFLLKAGVNKVGNFSFSLTTMWITFSKFISSWEIVVGFFLYGLSSILYLKLLSAAEVTKIYPASVAYMSIVLLLLGALFLKESLTVNKVIGTLIVVTGIYFLSK